jgi:UDP-GlcNAc:undecaprenyl-phosphate/decaprenyl-phosphate GlcNAc-1-phosphate transferase
LRLFVQLIAGCILVVFGIGILSINLPFLGVMDFNRVIVYGIPLVSAVFTVIWVMVILNTMNLLDGVSGLSSGVSFVAAFTIFILSIHPQIHENPQSQVAVATLALIVAIISLAFLLFDFPKPRILMGDTGSTFLGFVLATLAIFSGGKVATAFLVLGIPILDMIWVVLRRIFTKKPIFKGDMNHLHHRLLALGLSERAVVMIYLFISAIFGFTAIMFVSGQQKLFVIIALVILMLLLATALVLIPRRRQN